MIILDEYRLKLMELHKTIIELGNAINVTVLDEKIAQFEAKSMETDFWSDMDISQKILIELKSMKDQKSEYAGLFNLYDDAMTMIEMAQEEEDEALSREIADITVVLEKSIERQTLETLLDNEYDHNNAILSFHAGSGGTEAQDWAQMLYRMYFRYGEKNNFKVKILDYLDGDEAGIKSAMIAIEGINAYGFLKSEHGVHRLVRISPFDASGRRHTSFASVEVMPDLGEESNKIEIKEEDMLIEAHRASGAGGQHVNKTDSAIRIKHLPTGIVVGCQNERSQKQNREVAIKMLKSKLLEIKEREHLDKIEDIKGEQLQISWGSQIRSYVFMPYTLVNDHRTGYKEGNVNEVMDGEIGGFINEYLKFIKHGEKI